MESLSYLFEMRLLVAAYSMRTEDFGISEDVGDLACGYITRQGRVILRISLIKRPQKVLMGEVNSYSSRLPFGASLPCGEP